MSINIITGTISQQQVVDNIDLQDIYQIVNCPEQNIIDDHTLISKQYADDNYTGSGSVSDRIQNNNSQTQLVASQNQIKAHFTGAGVGIIDFKNATLPISLLCEEPISSSNPVTLNYADDNYIAKTSNIGVQSQNLPVTVDINANGHSITNVSDPVDLQDVSTKNYVDIQTDSTLLNANGYTDTQINQLSTIYMQKTRTLAEISTDNLNLTSVNFNGQLGTNIHDPVSAQDIASKKYVDDQVISGNFLPNTSTIQSIYNLNQSDVVLTGNKFSSDYVAVSDSDIPNKLFVDTQISNVPTNYLSDTSTLQQIYSSNGGDVNLSNNKFQSSYLATNTNDIPNIQTVNALDLAAISTAVQDSNDFTVQQLADKNYINYTNLSLEKSRIECELNQITLKPNEQSTSTQNLIFDCQNKPANTGIGTGVVRISAPDLNPLLFLDIPTVSRYPVYDSEICTKLYADGKMPGSYSLQNIEDINSAPLDMGTNAVYSSSIPIVTNQLTNKSYVDEQFASVPSNYYLNTTTLNNISLADSDLSMNSHRITNLSIPTVNSDASTKQYSDNIGISANSYTDSQLSALSLQTIFDQNITDLSLGNQVIYSTHVPNNNSEYTNKLYVDNAVSGAGGGLPSSSTLNSISLLNPSDGDIDANSQSIINIKEPVNNQDACSKFYVDNIKTIHDLDSSVVCSTTDTLINNTGSMIVQTGGLSLAGQTKITNILPGTASGDVASWDQCYNIIQATLSGTQTDSLKISSNLLQLKQQNVNNLSIIRAGGNETQLTFSDRVRNNFGTQYQIQGSTNANGLLLSDASSQLIYSKGGSSEMTLNGVSHVNIIGNQSRGSVTISPTSIIQNVNSVACESLYDDGVSSGIVRNALGGTNQTVVYHGMDGQNLQSQHITYGDVTGTSTQIKCYFNGFLDLSSGTKISLNALTGYTFPLSTELATNNDFSLVSKGVVNNYILQAVPAGTYMDSVISWGNASQLLPHHLACDGSTFVQATYPLLYMALGNSNVLPNFSGKYTRCADSQSDTTGRIVINQNASHVHSLNSGTITMNPHNHGSGTLATIASNTSANTAFTCSSTRQGGYLGGATSNNMGTNASTLVSTQSCSNSVTFTTHTHPITSVSLTGTVSSVTDTGALSGNSGSQGGSQVEVNSLVTWKYISTGKLF